MAENSTLSNTDSSTFSDTDSSTFGDTQSLSPLETWISFVSMLVPTIIGTLLYAVIFIAIFKNPKKFSGPYYTYFISIGIGEILWLHYYGTFGCVCIAYGYCPVSRAVNRVLTSFGGWVLYYVEFSGDAMIAIDRLVAVCFFKKYDSLFTPKRAKICAILIWILPFPISMPVLIWEIPSSYYVSQLTDYFDYDNDQSTLFNNVTTGIEYVMLVLCLLAYIICVGYLIWRRRQHGGSQSSGMRKAQRNLMIQGLLHFLLLFAYDIFWLLLSVDSFWVAYTGAVIIQVVPLNTTIITLCMNEGIRNEVFQLFKRKRAKMIPGSMHGRTNVSTVPETGLRSTIPPLHALLPAVEELVIENL